MIYKSIVGAICACLALVSFNVSAALVETGLFNSGDGLLTIDSNGNEWLDLGFTVGLSYNQITGGLVSIEGEEYWLTGNRGEFITGSSGQQIEGLGFKYALNDEVRSLWAEGGLFPVGFTVEYAERILNFITLMSPTRTVAMDTLTSYELVGATICTFNHCLDPGNPVNTDSLLVAVIWGDGVSSFVASNDDELYPNQISINDAGPQRAFGSYLVREPAVVPIPAAVLLFGSGLITLVGLARRKKA